ncbi:MAG: beta-galactosidase, partial [Alistipes sp.]|nr:beta-galactosidase [Alistipes sp.]
MKTRLTTFALTLLALAASAQVRVERTLDKGWRFTRDDAPSFASATLDDASWQAVTLPHDWAIYGPFSIHNDKQLTAIAQDGQKEAMEHAGRTGGLPFVGAGWYRLALDLDEKPGEVRYTLLFDGAMSHARVYV